MRANYATLKSELTTQLSPVVVVSNNAVGGRFTLINGGKQVETVDPVPEYFELAKSIAHVPLGIYSVLAAYLSDQVPNIPNADRIDPHDLDMVVTKAPGDKGWITPLNAFKTTLQTARTKLGTANLPLDLENSCDRILGEAVKFIDASVTAQSFDMVSFNRFAATVYPSIRVNMTFAATAQITGIEGLMKRWRTLIGEKAWSDLYVTVLSIWTTAELNQASIIIRRTMNQAKVDTHLIDLPTVETPRTRSSWPWTTSPASSRTTSPPRWSSTPISRSPTPSRARRTCSPTRSSSRSAERRPPPGPPPSVRRRRRPAPARSPVTPRRCDHRASPAYGAGDAPPGCPAACSGGPGRGVRRWPTAR
ncbi:hypothetical protein LV779_17905 [Streptomyces thinghirensis]|nr:hypothetical protein [Streptomyces thinghirensis]